jgi:hypothetical protein
MMSLLQHKPAVAQQVYELVIHGNLNGAPDFKTIPKADRVWPRVRNRVVDGLLPGDELGVDLRLAMGLMIMVKEHLGKGKVWEDCKTFSSLWSGSGWTYDGRGMSYKTASFAMTAEAITTMVKLVGWKKVTQLDIVADTLLVANKDKAKLKGLVSNDTVKQGLKQVFVALQKHKAGMIGVAKEAFINGNPPGGEPYGFVAHWVYLPKQVVNDGEEFNAKVWTWGGEKTLEDLVLRDGRIYLPRVALLLND